MEVAIFGAQGIALGTYQAFHSLYPNRKVHCFLVTQKENNAVILEGIPVLELDKFSKIMSQEEKNKIEVLIATPENIMSDIETILEDHGFYYYVRLTSLRWAQLMGYHYICNKAFMPLSALPVGCHRADIHMFIAKFYKDQPLKSDHVLPNWIVPVQAGSALCKERVAGLLDSDGENISQKNGNYSELTVLYWMWKNCLTENEDREAYYGLSHYRRILELSEDDLLRMEDNEVDVVLPYPMPYEPDIEEHHKRYLAKQDWQALLTALRELRPEYADACTFILRQKYLYNYNIILARKKVLVDYCNWLFPILERVEQVSEPRGWERKDRYIGYLGETLETLYFMYNQNKLEIVHTGLRFLV